MIEGLKRFLIYQTQTGPMFWLQSVEDEKAAFCLLAPFQAGSFFGTTFMVLAVDSVWWFATGQFLLPDPT